jgi:hypothetical protein
MVTPYAEGVPPCCCFGTLVRRACCSWLECGCHEMFGQHSCTPRSVSAPCAHRGNSAPEPMLRGSSGVTTLLRPDVTCAALQYHYRPGTITGWIAGLLDRHADRRRSARLTAPCFRCMPALLLTSSPAKEHCRAATAGQPHSLLASMHTRCIAAKASPSSYGYRCCRAGADQGVHGRLLRHDALRPRECAAAGAQT